MLYTKTTNITGIDWWVDKHQQDRYVWEKQAFGLTDSNCDSYGLIYKNYKNESLGFIPEWFKNDTASTSAQEYRPVLWDDKKAAMSFYYIENIANKTDTEDLYTIGLVYMCNLNKLILASKDRDDGMVRNMVCGHSNRLWEFFIARLSIGAQKAFSDFTLSKDNYPSFDMQPYHCFRVSYEILVEADSVILSNPITNF